MKDQLSNHATRRTCRAFSLVELMLGVLILTIIVLVLGQIMSQGTIITRTGNKRIDTDTQARAVLDRMAVDFGHMLKRTDIDCYIKAPVGYKNPKSHGKANKLQTGQQGNDQIAFFSQVPGYYPQTTGQSPLSLVAYRINSDNTSASYLKLQRM